MVKKKLLKAVIWLFDISMEFIHGNQVLENIKTFKVKKKKSIWIQSEKMYNYFVILTYLRYPFEQNSENYDGQKIKILLDN